MAANPSSFASSSPSPHLNRNSLTRAPSFLFSRTSSLKPPLSNDSQRVSIVRSHDINSSYGEQSMESVDSSYGASRAPSLSSSSAIDFLTLCHRLKTTKRKGWINHGLKGAESIADHMYRMSLMALIAGDIPGVKRERCIKMAIVHDIAEAIVGDITPWDGVPKEEKSRREQAALSDMCKVLGAGCPAEEIQELWSEYENNSSLEANLVKDFDKVEMILQALEYETEHGKVLDEFFLSTAGKFQTEIGKQWAAEITSRRNSIMRKKHG
ncbi:hypothetical protein Syun_014156 [Stephania yunnanensis]|uniref:5'-deoxynucleotidase n=1 Tax=Stephania yunnanensis TaxID=152371 RepID=A0AAP0JIS5_9MAGN